MSDDFEVGRDSVRYTNATAKQSIMEYYLLSVITYQYLPNITIVVVYSLSSPSHICLLYHIHIYLQQSDYTIEQERNRSFLFICTYLSWPDRARPTTVWNFEGLGGRYIISLFLFFFFLLMSTYDIIFSLLWHRDQTRFRSVEM